MFPLIPCFFRFNVLKHIRKILTNISYTRPVLDLCNCLLVAVIFQVGVNIFVDVDCRSQFPIVLSLIL